MITTLTLIDIPNDGCSTLLLHLMSNFSLNNSNTDKMIIQNIIWGFSLLFLSGKASTQTEQLPSYSVSEKQVTQPDYAHSTMYFSITRTDLVLESFVQNDGAKMAVGLRDPFEDVFISVIL